MHINVTCEFCGAARQFPASMGGQKAQCVGCGNPLVIPQAVQVVQTAAPPAAPPSHPAPPPPKPTPSPQYEYSKPAPPRKTGRGLFGCCLTTLVVIALVAIGGYFVFRTAKREIANVMNQVSGLIGTIEGLEDLANAEEILLDYEEKGYERIEGQIIKETEPIDNKRLYIAQVLEIKSDVSTDIAIFAQSATIRGTINGDLDFAGQMLNIEKGAVVKGDVNCRLGQVLVINGKVEGKLRGGYQSLQGNPANIKGGTEGTQKALASLWGRREREAKQKREIAQLKFKDPEVSKAASELVRARSFSDRGRALKKLAKITPNDDDRDNVVKLVTPQLGDIHSDDEAFDVIKAWGNPTHSHVIVNAIQNERRFDKRDGLKLLLDWQAKDAVLQLINHHDSSLRSDAFRKVESWDEIGNEQIARQCLKDINKMRASGGSGILSHTLRRSRNLDVPVERLKKLEFDNESLKQDVTKAVIPLTRHSSVSRDAFEILKKTVTSKDIDQLLKFKPTLTGGGNFGAYYDLLVQTKSPKAYEYLVKSAIEIRSNWGAKETLTSNSVSEAESFVWPYLRDSQSHRVNRACGLLAKIGTEKSLPHLRQIENGNSRQARSAKRAIKEIESRVNQ